MENELPPLRGNDPQSSSLESRLSNIFIAPGEVFDEVKISRTQTANWLVPLLLAMVSGIIYTLVAFSQPAVIQKMTDAQDQKFQQLADEKKMSQEQADQMKATVAKFMTPTVLRIMGLAMSVVGSAIFVFFVALVLWMVAKFAFGTTLEFMKAVEISALPTMITILGTIISMLLVVIFGDLRMTPGPILLVGHIETGNKLHAILSATSVITLWYIAVLAIGLSKMTNATFSKAAAWLYGLWAFITYGMILAFGAQ